MLLIDFSPIIIGAAFISGEEMSEDLIRHLTLNTILSYRKRWKEYGEVVIAFDSRNYWRKKEFSQYKGHRKKAKEESSFDWDLFYQYQNNIKKEIAEVFPYRFIEIDGLEADDIIGHLALTASEPTIIVSPDGDFRQCARNPNVQIYSTLKKKILEADTLYDVEFDLHCKIMKGDKGDNIRNVMSSLYETSRQPPVSQRLLDYTFSNGIGEDIKERYQENRKLIDLREIPDEYKLKIEEAMKPEIKVSKGKIFNYLSQKKLNRVGHFLSEIESFI